MKEVLAFILLVMVIGGSALLGAWSAHDRNYAEGYREGLRIHDDQRFKEIGYLGELRIGDKVQLTDCRVAVVR